MARGLPSPQPDAGPLLALPWCLLRCYRNTPSSPRVVAGCSAAHTNLPALPAPMPAAGCRGCLHGVEPKDVGTLHPHSLAGASTGTMQGLLVLGLGSSPSGQDMAEEPAGSWHGAVLQNPARQHLGAAQLPLPRLTSLALWRCSFLSRHIP